MNFCLVSILYFFVVQRGPELSLGQPTDTRIVNSQGDQPIMMDCGYIAARRRRHHHGVSRPFRVSLVRQTFPLSTVGLPKCWPSSNVTESVHSGSWNGIEAAIPFNLSISSLQNITTAKLTIVSPASTHEPNDTSQVVLNDIQFSGVMTYYANGTNHTETITIPRMDSTEPGNPFTYDVLPILRNASSIIPSSPDALQESVNVVFFVRRVCSAEYISQCPAIINLRHHVPNLRVSYA